MKFYDLILTYFNLKERNAPKREHWVEYANFSDKYSNHLLKDSNVLLFGLILISCIYPLMLLLVLFAIYYRSLTFFGDKVDDYCDKGFEAQQIVYLIQSNHIQSLKEKLIHNPNLVDALYKKKSLLYWSKYYNNLMAHKMLLEIMKEKNFQNHKRSKA